MGGLSVAATLALAAPAQAEGSWSSYWYRVLPGVTTRTWTDQNVDANNTYVKFRYCNYTYIQTPYTLSHI